MAKRVFFSFHYQDVIDFRANVVRNHWLTKKDRDDAGFFDASIWESAKKQGDVALKRLINGGVTGTTRTAVLVGSDTANRRWVRYEIFRSIWAHNAVIAVHINGIKGRNGRTKANGTSPFSVLGLYYSVDGKSVTPCYLSGGSWYTFDDYSKYTLGSRAAQSRWGRTYSLDALGYRTYDWVANNGYNNFGSWVA